MIELGRASGNFARFKTLLKNQIIRREDVITIIFEVERNKIVKEEFLDLLTTAEQNLKGDFTLSLPT